MSCVFKSHLQVRNWDLKKRIWLSIIPAPLQKLGCWSFSRGQQVHISGVYVLAEVSPQGLLYSLSLLAFSFTFIVAELCSSLRHKTKTMSRKRWMRRDRSRDSTKNTSIFRKSFSWLLPLISSTITPTRKGSWEMLF